MEVVVTIHRQLMTNITPSGRLTLPLTFHLCLGSARIQSHLLNLSLDSIGQAP